MTNRAEYQKEWRRNNYEHHRELIKNWQKKHPDKVRLYRSQRRALTKGKIVLEDIINWQSRICGICIEPITGSYHIDHIIPVSKGGEHVTGNLQLAHPYCNQSKFNHLPTSAVVLI